MGQTRRPKVGSSCCQCQETRPIADEMYPGALHCCGRGRCLVWGRIYVGTIVIIAGGVAVST